MKLKTIAEHNEEVLHVTRRNENLTGVECPNCKTELQFIGRGVMLSSPMQRDVKCFNCNYANRLYVL